MERYSASRPTSGSTGKERPLDNGIPSPSCSPGIQRYLVIPRRVKEAFFAWALGQAQPVSARCGTCGTVKSDPRRYNPVTLELEMNATVEGPLSDHALRRCVCRKVISSRSVLPVGACLHSVLSIVYHPTTHPVARTRVYAREDAECLTVCTKSHRSR
jgi:hypothetical protein